MVRKQSKASWRRRGAPLAEAALDSRRIAGQEQRTGGSVTAASSDELFTIEVAVPAAAQKVSSREKARGRTLHVDRVLAPNPHVKRVMEERAKPIQKKQPAALKNKLARLREASELAKRQEEARAPATMASQLDVWGAAEVLPPAPLRTGPRAAPLSARRGLRTKPERSVDKKAVVAAPEGGSYNPTAEAHRELIEEAAAIELERQRKIRSQRFGAFTRHKDDLSDNEEEEEEEEEGGAEGGEQCPVTGMPMRDGVYTGDTATRGGEGAREGGEEGGEEESDDGDEGGAAARKAQEKLTTAQRNKRQRAKEREAAERAAAAERKRARQAGRAGQLSAELDREASKLQQKQALELERAEKKRKKASTRPPPPVPPPPVPPPPVPPPPVPPRSPEAGVAT